VYHERGVATRGGYRGGGPVLHRLWTRVRAKGPLLLELRIREAPSRPTKANPAPTSTPEEILASLEEEAQAQPAEAPRADSPEPVREAVRVMPPQQERAAESGPEARRREDMRYAVGGGLLLGVAIAFFGIVGGAPWWGVLPVAGFLGLAFWGHVYQERPKRRGERAPFRNSSLGTATVRSRSIPQWAKIAVATRDGGRVDAAAATTISSTTTSSPSPGGKQHQRKQHPTPLRQVQPAQEQPLRRLRLLVATGILASGIVRRS
jgi:hypothetical protein